MLVVRYFLSFFLAFSTQAGFAVDLLPVHKPKGRQGADLIPYDNIFYTAAADVRFIGPIIPIEKTNESAMSDYVAAVFRALVQKADEIVRDEVGDKGYKEGSENHNYYTFLILALTVPHHESHLTHARYNYGESCQQELNTFTKAAPGTRNIMRPLYRDTNSPLFPDCRFFRSQQIVTQLASNSRYEDIGLMQINPKSHPNAAEPKVFFNLYETVNYGLNYLYEGYKVIAASPQKYHCLAYNPYSQYRGTRAMPNYNLVRAAWASKYNSGNTLYSSVCRFSQTGENKDPRDTHFLKSLEDIVKYNNSIYHTYLRPGSAERKALDEIIYNYRAIFTVQKEQERNENLKIILASQRNQETGWEAPARFSNAPTHILKKGKIDLYSAPVRNQAAFCGHIESNGAIKVEAHESIRGMRVIPFTPILVPAYNNYVHLYKPKHVVELAPTVNQINIRSSPLVTKGAEASNVIAQITRLKGTKKSPQLDVLGLNKGVDGDWIHVRTVTGEEGFVHSQGVKIVTLETEPPAVCHSPIMFISQDSAYTINFSQGRKYIGSVKDKGDVFILVQPLGGSRKVERLSPGDEVIVLGDNKETGSKRYYEVNLVDKGKTGWVYHGHLELHKEIE